MRLSLKLKIFILYIIGLTFSQTVFSYTFFVETSQFNGDVYVIENVVRDKESKSIDQKIVSDQKSIDKDKNEDKVVSNINNIPQIDEDDNFIREHKTNCTNLKSKPLLNTTQQFKRESAEKGLSLSSFNTAMDFWNNSEARDSLDNCNKLNKDHLFKTVSSLQKILLEKKYHNSLNSFPKIYSFDKNINEKLGKISSKSEEKYLKELLIEVSNLRKDLLRDTENDIIFSHYNKIIREKSQDQKLSNNEKQFIKDYNKFQINYKIEKLGYGKKSFLKNKNINENITLINNDFYNDISPMLDLFFITSDPKSYEYKNDFNYENPSSVIIKFSNLMNNL